eukprot:802702-Prorocentrum_minimum.AAC.2
MVHRAAAHGGGGVPPAPPPVGGGARLAGVVVGGVAEHPARPGGGLVAVAGAARGHLRRVRGAALRARLRGAPPYL